MLQELAFIRALGPRFVTDFEDADDREGVERIIRFRADQCLPKETGTYVN